MHFSELLPGRLTTGRIVSSDGKTYFDLDSGTIGGTIVVEESDNNYVTVIEGGKINTDCINTNNLVAKKIRTATSGRRIEINHDNSHAICMYSQTGPPGPPGPPMVPTYALAAAPGVSGEPSGPPGIPNAPQGNNYRQRMKDYSNAYSNSNGGSVYKQTVNIIRNTSIGNPSALGVNSRYVFSLTGLQLGLSPISVVDWISGGSVAGGNVANTAYPTFRGTASTNCILTFSNGLSQTISFNSQGEYTVKPVGRTIVQVEVNGNTCPANLILGQMIIDLNALIAQCTPDN